MDWCKLYKLEGLKKSKTAKAAELALRLFTDARVARDIQQYRVADMMANLLHFCRKAGFDGEAAFASAMNHFHAEIAADDTKQP